MALLLVLAKPILYVVAFAIAAQRFQRFGPHWKAPTWLVVALATAARLAAGAISAMIATSYGRDSWVLFGGIVFTFGFVFWLGVAGVAFQKTPRSHVVTFAQAAELMSGALDVLIWHSFQSISFC